jgi:hypothetical protein
MNHNQICACLNFGKISKSDYLNTYSRELVASMAAENYRFDFQGIRTLYALVDFIGLSAYPSMFINSGSTRDMEAPQKMNVLELSFFGVHVQQMIAQGKEVVISETGEGPGGGAGLGMQRLRCTVHHLGGTVLMLGVAAAWILLHGAHSATCGCQIWGQV